MPSASKVNGMRRRLLFVEHVQQILPVCAALHRPREPHAHRPRVMYRIRYAISSRQPTISPCRSSTTWMKFDAWTSDSCVPVSSHAMPRPSRSTRSWPRRRYSRLTSVISSSPRADGFEHRRDLDHLVVVEIQPGDGVRRFRLRGLLFEADRAPVGVELDDAVALGIADLVAEHRRARLRGAAALRSASEKPAP